MTQDVRSQLQMIVQSFSYSANKLASTMERQECYRALSQEVEKYRAAMRVILKDTQVATRAAAKMGTISQNERATRNEEVVSAVNAGLQHLDRVLSQYTVQAMAA